MKAVEAKTGITQHTFQRWARNNESIEDILLRELLIQYRVSIKYIRTGIGHWKVTDKERIELYQKLLLDDINAHRESEDFQYNRIIALAERLSSEDRELIISVSHKLLQEKKNKTLRSLGSLILTFPQNFYKTAFLKLRGLQRIAGNTK
ncbi:hypothetical protein LEP1GSC178_0065 [Leptospira licerasiae str. MMD4847]|uniref:XRE family transcriptional regulator n=2 Tax=Leptospira licerasiae TaxID=447106 RepID=A0ABN0H9H4_9LEPT|nr:hypothetical protein LEP1GSC178_0065 [Leptospira licerasiae str. MMD4847]